MDLCVIGVLLLYFLLMLDIKDYHDDGFPYIPAQNLFLPTFPSNYYNLTWKYLLCLVQTEHKSDYVCSICGVSFAIYSMCG